MNDDGSNKSINSIQKAVGRFRSKLDKNANYKRDLLCQKLAKQIDKYDERLFADPIEVDTPSGKITIYPQRTNNLLEQFFGVCAVIIGEKPVTTQCGGFCMQCWLTRP